MNDDLVAIKEICAKYVENPMCVYESTGKEIIVMEKMCDTETDEMRSGIVDSNYARFRASKLRIVDIIKKSSPFTKIDKIIFPSGVVLTAKVGEIIMVSRFVKYDIHYFKTLEAAYYYRMPNIWQNPYVEYDYNGSLVAKREIVESKDCSKELHETRRITRGSDSLKCEYVNEKRHGIFECIRDGRLMCRCTYVNGLMNGVFESFYSNGSKYEIYNFVNGLAHGICEKYDEYNKILFRSNYVNGFADSYDSYDAHGNCKKVGPSGGVRYQASLLYNPSLVHSV